MKTATPTAAKTAPLKERTPRQIEMEISGALPPSEQFSSPDTMRLLTIGVDALTKGWKPGKYKIPLVLTIKPAATKMSGKARTTKGS